jgi:hypothetical protein
MRDWLKLLAGLLVLSLAHAAAEEPSEEAFKCPFEYERHSLQQILDGEVRPWLWVSG